MTLPPWLQKLFGMLSQILGIVQQLNSGPTDVSRETSPYSTQNAAQASQTLLNDPSYGLHEIMLTLGSLGTAMASNTAAILAAIGSPVQVGSPVTLPTTPPTGYGADTTSIAADVWGYSLPGSGQTAGDQQDNAGNLGRNLGAVGAMFRTYNSQWFTVGGTWHSNVGPNSYNADPIFPIANILSTDTLSSFLERESFWTGWADPLGSGYYRVAQGGGSDFYYETTITAAEFLVLRDGPAAIAGLNLAPVWPGVANITSLGMSDLAALTEIDEPMDGVIIGLFSVPANLPHYTYGSTTAYGHVGALAFVDDNGQAEQFQAIQFNDQVLCPKTMKRAAGVVWRVTPGLAGGITPWTINS